jgi:hypothetical protein
MLVTIKHFYETSQEDSVNYETTWIENENRMIYLPIHLNETQQTLYVSRNLLSNPNKDILAIKMPSFVERNSIFRQIRNGIGFEYNGDQKWYPSEIWIYETYR